MNLLFRIISTTCVAAIWIHARANADLPCAARECPGQSVVCVCNETYCDEVERTPVALGQYVSYTSSKSGLRFYKQTGVFSSAQKNSECDLVLELYPEESFHKKMEGFGGSVTDAAGINWRSLPPKLQRDLIYSYFGKKGLEYNMIRCPIGGSDFSTHPYTLNDFPRDDKTLSHFSLTEEDYRYKLPMLRMAREASCGRTQVVATCWSPPTWMKTNENITGRSSLKHDYFQAYADYHYKFIESYTHEGIPIWAVTTTNEPQNGVFDLMKFNTLGWKAEPMAEWIAKHLGPTLRNSEHRDVKIICCDDQLSTLPVYFNKVIEADPEALQYIDGVGVHWYLNEIVPPSFFSFVSKKHPDKFIIATEACEGFKKNDVILGSWDRAMNYISDIIKDLNYNLVGWIDWNLCLDERGGPNWVENFVDSPVIVFKDRKEFVKQPMFYAMGHFSKWIPRGSVRINIEVLRLEGLEQVAFRTPEENIVVILHNKSECSRKVAIVVGNKETVVALEPYSVCTVEFPFTYAAFGVRRGYVRPPPNKQYKSKLLNWLRCCVGTEAD